MSASETSPQDVEIVVVSSYYPAPIPLTNGIVRAELPIGEPVKIDASLIPALEHAEGISFRYVGEAGGPALTAPEIGESFDAAAILAGTIDDVVPLLIHLSSDELVSLREAEKAGEKRKGVLSAIDKVVAAAN